MNMRRSLQRALALLCCAAMLLPCLPVALAAEDCTANFDFENYASQEALNEVWKQTGNSTLHVPELSTAQVKDGKYSMLLEDSEANKGVQARTRLGASSQPAGTEYILSVDYYAESVSGTGVPYIRLYSAAGRKDANTYSTGRWDKLSVIYTTTTTKETLYAFLISNSATLSKVYYDNVSVKVLDEELALQYVDEKLSVPGCTGIADGLASKALGLNNVNGAMGAFYGRAMKAVRAEKGAPLTVAELQACVDTVNTGDTGPIFEDGFEDYSGDADLRSIWTMNTSSDNTFMKASADRAYSGKQSFLLEDANAKGSLQVKATVNTVGQAGTEYILKTMYYVQSNDGSTTPFIRLYANNGYSTVYTHSTDRWDPLSTIWSTGVDKQNMTIFMGSNSAPTCKVYFDDIQVLELTEELAVGYVNEKAQIPNLLPEDMMGGLNTKVLGLTGVNESAGLKYVEALQAARKAKGSDLTRAEIQAGIVNGNMAQWAEENKDATVYQGVTGRIPVPADGLPQGVSAQWASVSPANKNITVSNGVASVTAVPTGADDVYSAVLRLTGANKSVDVNYTIRLVNTAALDKQEVEWARQIMGRIDVLGMDRTGTVAVPAEVTANGISAQWTAIKSNPNSRLALSGSTLSVKSLPSGMDYDEAVAALKLTKGSAAVEMDVRIVTYDKTYRTLVALPNSSLEVLGADGMPEDWEPSGAPTEVSYVEVSDRVARTGTNSVRIVDRDAVTANSGLRSRRDAVTATVGSEYVVTYWAKGTASAETADRAGAAAYVEFNTDAKTRKTANAGPVFPVSADRWTQVTMRGTANAAYVDVMAYSYQATVMDLYVDDFLLWEVSADGIVLEVDAALKSGKDADALYTLLGTKSLGVSGLTAANKAAYLSGLAAKRAAKGSALTAAELAAGVKEVNDSVTAQNKAVVTKLAKEVKTSQTITRPGVIELPKLSDSSVTVKYTQVTGDGAFRIRLTGLSARVESLPNYGKKDETAVLTLTITKGEASTTVNVNITLKAYSKTMSDLIAAGQTLNMADYLGGQPANYVTGDLKELPASLSGGIAVKWQALDSATLSASSAMTAQGKVTRPAYGEFDAAVILRATLSKNGESYDSDLYLIVPAVGAQDARAVITRNPDFEAEASIDEFAAPDGWLKNLKWADGPKEILTSYANVVADKAYSGAQSLRVTADGKMASLQNANTTTAREGFTYTLEVMAYTESDLTAPSVSLKFWDNEGLEIAIHKVAYTDVPGGRGVWKNLAVSGVAPAGAVVVTAELNGGTKAGTTWFDAVRLREYPIVANGGFDLGKAGWETSGSVSDGKLTLSAGQTAVSMPRSADRGVTYYLSVEAEGGKAALRFVDKDGRTLAEYGKDMKSGLNAFFAYAPVNTAGVQAVLTGPMTADNVKITRSVTGTGVTDGDFEISANGGTGTPWELTNAVIGANTGKTGAGLTVKTGGVAVSTVIPVEDGKSYVFSADVKGKAGKMEIKLYNFNGLQLNQRTVTSAGDGWNTVTCTFDQLPEAIHGSVPEQSYAQIVLSGEAVFDNVKAYSVSRTVSEASMENTKVTPYGTFPHNWAGYGRAATYVANQDGQFTEGVKGLAVELFGLGEGGVRSSMIRDVKGGKAYEATIKAKGSGAKLAIEFWDSDFKKLGSQSVLISSADFKTYSVKGTAPSGATYASLSVGGEGTGLVYVDEAILYPVVRSIGTNTQLFMDDWLIADSQNVKRTFQKGEKQKVMFTGGWYPMVHWDAKEQVYKMWYQVSGYYMMLRTSKDGVNWSAATACYLNTGEKIRGNSVHIDDNEPDPNKRYKGIFFNHVQSRVDGSYDYYTSPDGIIWTYEAKGIRGQDVVTSAYDPFNDEYIVTYKISMVSPMGTQNKRTHSTVRSKDLIHWTEGVRQYTVGTVGDTVAEDMIRTDGYGTGMYPLGDSYVAMNWRFLLDDADSFGGLMDSTLLFSRDLDEDWQRMYHDNGDLVVAIPRGNPGEWDDAQTYSADTAINIGNETWWYYAGWSGDHGTAGVPKTPAISAVKWRRNGFASMDFGTNGTLTTQQFTLVGSKVHLNAKGSLKVELLDAAGAVYATASFSGDSVDSVLAFDKDISGQVGKTVSLRFTGSGAQLYTLQLEGSMFGDVATDAWYHRAAHYAVENGIMSGYGGGKFGPNDTLSRAMVVQMLFNKEGQNPVSGSHGFTDVPADQWFNNAVTWGTRKGVMSGYGGGKFGPNDAVTIEQIAVILWNYSGNPEFTATAEGLGEHSGWAANALGWAVENGLLANMPYGKVTDKATRAQAAQMLTNYLRF